ncbi:SGNH/GDSL hydrolase family protein [Cerasicoccus maritimus]|uniref:SGNH/GDSL hydrolase family protein n=1 Tax=Cerasicoccus maritimus TaxID=490089 RepID=UPI0028526B0A|nr:SGNH/GDSL hydrolase family protein [Cerasicoccus maritimus]
MSDLPKVLIIGDSISIGYTPFVEQAFEGRAIIERNEGNASSTEVGLEKLDQWLGDTQWDVIHFNWGLHDMKYINADREMVGVSDGRQWVKVERYADNLFKLVTRLKKTGAQLIFATTTPVPIGVNGRVPGDHVRYNEAALAVMMGGGVRVNDLCAHIEDDRRAKGGKVADVHYTGEGYEYLSRAVIHHIKNALHDVPAR